MGAELEKVVCSAVTKGKRTVWQPVRDQQRQLLLLMAKTFNKVSKAEGDQSPQTDEEEDFNDSPTSLVSPVDIPSMTAANSAADVAQKKTAEFVVDFHRRRSAIQNKHSPAAFLDVLDFAGQETFAVLQHILITNERCGSAVVFDVSKPLDAIAEMSICVDGVEHTVANAMGKTNFDIIEEWLSVLYNAGGGECPLYLIACQIDRVSFWEKERDAYKSKVQEYLWRNLEGKPYASVVESIYFVDNTKSGSSFEYFSDDAVSAFRDRFVDDMMRTSSLTSSVPLRWLPFTVALLSLAEQRRPVLALSEAVTLAMTSGGCSTTEEALELLQFHHHLGNLLHFSEHADLQQHVIVDIHWLIRIVSALLIPRHDVRLQDRRFRSQYALLYKKGILLESLALHLWLIHCPDEAAVLILESSRQFVFSLLEEFALVFFTKQVEAVENGEPCRKYLVPSLVTNRTDETLASTNDGHVVCSVPLYVIVGPGKLFPMAVFWRLVVCLLLYVREKLPDASRAVVPLLHQNSAKLLIDHSAWLELQLISTGIGLTVQLDTDATLLGRVTVPSKPLGAICPEVLTLVETKLSLLEGASCQRLHWKHACLCVCSLSLAACTKHLEKGCSNVECQHFVELVAGLVPRCPLGDQRPQDVSAAVSTWLPELTKVSEDPETCEIMLFLR